MTKSPTVAWTVRPTDRPTDRPERLGPTLENAVLGPDLGDGYGDGRIASLPALGVGERPVRRPETQREGQRLLPSPICSPV